MSKPEAPSLSKEEVRYRTGNPARHCGNCVMFHPTRGSLMGTGRCDLVIGRIGDLMLCDKWEAKPE